MNKYAQPAKNVGKMAVWRFVGVVLLLGISGVFAYPAPWNAAMERMRGAVGVSFPQVPDRAIRLGLDLRGGAHLVYEADVSAVPEADRASALQGARDVIERRVNSFGVSEATVQTAIVGDSHRVIIDLPGVQDVTAAAKQIGETPVLNFRIPAAEEELRTEPTEEEAAQIAAAQEAEREKALTVMDRALAGEDFAALAQEFSIDAATRESGGVLLGVKEDDAEFGGFIREIRSRRLRTGVVRGLYEGTSRMHVMRYDARRTVNIPTARHILISWAGAERSEATRSKEEALALITQIKEETSRTNFIAQANTYTEDPSGRGNGGSLGEVEMGVMVQPFEDALFALKDRQISEVVETAFGYHLIFRESTRRETVYDLAHIELPWTTFSDVAQVDPWKDTELSGKHIRTASVATDPTTGRPYVLLMFNAEGAELFGKITSENVGNVIGIFLDGYPVSTPMVETAIYGGQAQITSPQFTLASAKQLAQDLNAGALPVPVTAVSQQTVGPTLGTASLAAGVQAALVGFALVSLFMVVYYRLPGVLAVVSLVFYAAANMVLFRWLGVTMTLSGIAGFAFSFGIAVDANVLVFERLKEELRSGRDLISAVEEACRRAWPSVRDGNATTLIATAVLYTMSTGFIRGFALTLTIGVLASMFSAFVLTRALLRIVATKKSLKSARYFVGVPRS